MNPEPLTQAAKSAGFSEAVFLDGLTVECEAHLRAYCNPEGCPNHGQNWVFPPMCGSLAACAERAAAFNCGLVLQSATALTPPTDMSVYKTLNREHNLRLRALLENTAFANRPLLALTSGGCVFCAECAYPAPCIKPGLRMNSLSAYGIDVGKLCAKAHLAYSFRPDMVYFTALILL